MSCGGGSVGEVIDIREMYSPEENLKHTRRYNRDSLRTYKPVVWNNDNITGKILLLSLDSMADRPLTIHHDSGSQS